MVRWNDNIRLEGTQYYENNEDIKHFSQFTSEEIIDLPERMPDVGQVVSIIADPEIVCLKSVNTIKGVSDEGQELSGKMVTAYIRLRQKILYSAQNPAQTIHSVENEIFQSACIVVPTLIEGTDIGLLIKYKFLKAKVHIEDTIIKKIDNRSIFKSISFYIHLHIIPTHLLCFSMTDEDGGAIYISHEDGKSCGELASGDDKEIVHPMWSPSGQEIAYLSGHKGNNDIFIMNPKDYREKRIIDHLAFGSVSSYCWLPDGCSILFSSRYMGGREIFSIGLHNMQCKQLTYGNAEIKSYKPRCSPDGRRIAFLRSVSGIVYLYIMDMNGLNCKMASESTGVKDFDWSYDSRHIGYIRSKGGRPDELCILDTTNHNDEVLVSGAYTIQKKKVQFSPDGRKIAFIGSDLCTEDVFVYDIDKCKALNITDNFRQGQVRDYTWKIDSTKIYYAGNELSHFNIFSVSLEDCSRKQLTNTCAKDMNLCYRPKIR